MITGQNAKVVPLVVPALVKSTSATTTTLDTKGFDYLSVFTVIGVTDAALSALKLTHSDKDNSGFVDLPGAAIDPLPTAGDGGNTYGIYVSLLNKKRYIRIAATSTGGSTGTNTAAIALLTRGHVTPHDADSRGLAGQAIVV